MSQSTLAILILVCIFISYVTQIIPLGVTSILGALAMAIFGIISFPTALAGFGSDSVMMIAGMMVVGSALAETGITDIIGRSVLRSKRIRENERLFLAAILVVILFISAFISNTATVAIFLPLVAGAARTSGGRITRKNTYMAVGITAVVGGNSTLIGSTPQMIAQGILSQTEGCREMAFFEMAKGALPLMLFALIFFSTFGYDLQKKVFTFPEADEELSPTDEKHPSGGRSKKFIVVIIFLGCVAGFVSNLFTPGAVALLGACACIATGCISAKSALSKMDWRSITVLGGALGFAAGLDQSGAVEFLVEKAMGLISGYQIGAFGFFALICVIASLLSVSVSNSATAAILVPVAIAVARTLQANPITFVIGVAICCNLDFITPIGTPPITMTLKGGYRFQDYLKVGGVFTAVSLVIVIVLLPVLYGL